MEQFLHGMELVLYKDGEFVEISAINPVSALNSLCLNGAQSTYLKQLDLSS